MLYCRNIYAVLQKHIYIQYFEGREPFAGWFNGKPTGNHYYCRGPASWISIWPISAKF